MPSTRSASDGQAVAVVRAVCLTRWEQEVPEEPGGEPVEWL